MDASTLPWISALIAFGGLCVTIYKIRHDDKREIDQRLIHQERELADFKIQVAQTHPTAEELRSSVASLKHSLDRLTDRIDRVLDQGK